MILFNFTYASGVLNWIAFVGQYATHALQPSQLWFQTGLFSENVMSFMVNFPITILGSPISLAAGNFAVGDVGDIGSGTALEPRVSNSQFGEADRGWKGGTAAYRLLQCIHFLQSRRRGSNPRLDTDQLLCRTGNWESDWAGAFSFHFGSSFPLFALQISCVMVPMGQ